MSEEELKIDLEAEHSQLNCIETDLWLGNLAAATDLNVLKEKKIKFIVTVNSFPLSKKITSSSDIISTKYIQAYDTPRDDLLSYFEEAYEFIDHALKKGVVLVHCYLGVSRSATIIVSYLMKKRKMSMIAALNYVKSKRKSVEPNPGFLEQLKLYEIMNCTIDKSNIQYKMFRLYIAIDHVKKENIVPECCADVIKPDPLLTVNADTIVYKCKKCRRVIARGSNIIPHVSKEKYSWRDRRWSELLEKTELCRLSYFIEPLAWMENIGISTEGKLHCPNVVCKNKLGSFNWVTGCPCPCGIQVCPAFCLIPSKVDEHRVKVSGEKSDLIAK